MKSNFYVVNINSRASLSADGNPYLREDDPWTQDDGRPWLVKSRVDNVFVSTKFPGIHHETQVYNMDGDLMVSTLPHSFVTEILVPGQPSRGLWVSQLWDEAMGVHQSAEALARSIAENEDIPSTYRTTTIKEQMRKIDPFWIMDGPDKYRKVDIMSDEMDDKIDTVEISNPRPDTFVEIRFQGKNCASAFHRLPFDVPVNLFYVRVLQNGKYPQVYRATHWEEAELIYKSLCLGLSYDASWNLSVEHLDRIRHQVC